MPHHDSFVLLIWAATLWILGSAFLLFPHFGLPSWMHRAAMTLLCGELLALLVSHYAPGTVAGDAADTVSSVDLPALTVLLWLLAVATGLRAQARRRRALGEPQKERPLTTRSR